MSDQQAASSHLEKLFRLGDVRNTQLWKAGEFDYVKEFGLTSRDIPVLIECVQQWLDDFDEDDDTAWGPVHSWRALGQLRATAAVEPLLDMLTELDEAGDDWYLEDFPHVWGMIGEASIKALSSYLADDEKLEFSRCAAITGLREISNYHPETRDQVVAILTSELAKERSLELDEDNGGLNGSLLAALLEMKAVESAETIERAFAANVIDPTIAGDWGSVRKELGVEGLGLAPDKTPGWVMISERMGFSNPLFSDPELPWQKTTKHEPTPEELQRRKDQELKRKRDADLKAKLKKKKERKNRKKGRKPR